MVRERACACACVCKTLYDLVEVLLKRHGFPRQIGTLIAAAVCVRACQREL